VLLENSDSESESHACSQFEALLEAALEAGCVSDAVVAENLTQAKGLWHIRESITLAQAEEGRQRLRARTHAPAHPRPAGAPADGHRVGREGD
jgi:hypothetical protein